MDKFNVKVGDEVILYPASSLSNASIVKVKRVTPTGIVIVSYFNSEMSFSPEGRERSSDGFRRAHIVAAPENNREEFDARVAEIRAFDVRRHRIHKIETTTNLRLLTDDQLVRIIAIIDEPKDDKQ